MWYKHVALPVIMQIIMFFFENYDEQKNRQKHNLDVSTSFTKSKSTLCLCVSLTRKFICVLFHIIFIKGTWQWDGFSGVFAEIGSWWVPCTTFQAVPILASNLRRYSYSKNDFPLSPLQRVADSAYHWYGESPTPCITDTRSRWLPASPIQRVGYWIFLKKTLCIDDTEVDSPHQW